MSNNSQIIPPIVSNKSNVKCCYGKQCKGMKRLKMHQRKCRVIFGFEDENLVQFLGDDTPLNAETNQTSADDMPISHLIRKDGILLPKSDKDWSIANNYFRTLFTRTVMDLNNINAIAEQLSLSSYDHVKLIMDHFKESDQSQLDNKYKNHTTRELKKDLKHLKENNAPLCETKYVSHLLRPKIKTSHSITSASLNHDSLISKNFWGYVKRVLQKRSSLIPTFTLQHCTQYFRKMLSDTLPDKQFHIPSWISQFEPPTLRFNLQPPSYQKVTAVVRRMKSSLSPSPLDLISNICFKRCPYLRSLLTEIISIIWKKGPIPSTWKNACIFPCILSIYSHP